MTGGNITVDNITVNSGTLKDVAQIFGGDGATPMTVTKLTNGVLTVVGTVTYTGATNVNAGIIIVHGSLSGTPALTLALGTELRGLGAINPTNGMITSSGTISPGDSGFDIGSFDTGNVVLNGGSVVLDLASAASNDRVNVTGTVSLNAPIALQLNFTAPFADGTAFRLIDNDGTDPIALNSGGFTSGGNMITPNVDFAVTSNGVTQTFQLTYAGGDSSNDVVLTAVPEPTPTATLLIGSAALVGLQRFRRRAQRL
jgi:autotransporter-associated beta strand protein